jgi:lipopolysaccharide export system protein LptC
VSPSFREWTGQEASAIVHSVARYTRFVRSTKVGLGIIALLLIGLILFYPLFRQKNTSVRIPLTSSSQPNPSSTSMINARFHGLDKDNQPYNLTAKTVSEISTDVIGLAEPAGEIFLKSSQQLSIKSRNGVFNRKDHLLTLKGNIEMFNKQGYIIRMETLFVDLANKTAVTSSEVHGQGELGTLKSYGGAMVDGNNEQIIFEGPVFVTLNMASKASDAQEKHE